MNRIWLFVAKPVVRQTQHLPRQKLEVAEVLVGLATDTTVYLSRRWEALKVNKLTFAIRASDFSWHPGRLGCPLFPRGGAPGLSQVARRQTRCALVSEPALG